MSFQISRSSNKLWNEEVMYFIEKYVKYNTKSSIKTLPCGVPQGSVLGPLVFIIYTNDLPNCPKVTKAILFADDTTIFLSSQNKQYPYESVNTDLHSINEWFQTNKLSLNVSKTNYVLSNNTRVDNADNFNLTNSKWKYWTQKWG